MTRRPFDFKLFVCYYGGEINTNFAKTRERMRKAKYWIDQLGLIPHPEGGFYKEVYKSDAVFEGDNSDEFPEGRALCTSIYFLLEQGDFSTFHRILSDELWHFYGGEALEIFHIDDGGKLHTTLLGNDLENGETLQAVVPADCWFGSRPKQGSVYSLVGCTVSPGFDFRDFEMANKEELLTAFPEYKDLIKELTR